MLAFRDVRVFDGERVHPQVTVLVRGDRIAAMGMRVPVPPGAQVIEGARRTLLPGLIDAHTHAFSLDALRQALAFGVTTELDMFTAHQFASQVRAAQRQGGLRDAADLLSAGTLATAPGGHGTQFGLPIPTLTEPQEAAAFVDARLAEGSDYIKIIYDDGEPVGASRSVLSLETVRSLIAASHRREKLAVVHISSRQAARDAVEAGADGLAHLFVDQPAGNAFIRAAKARGVFVMPTLSVIESVVGRAGGATLAADERFAPFLPAEARDSLRSTFPPGADRPSYAVAATAARRLHAAGVPLLAGTDAPNPGTAHGASLHRELELLVDAGLTPLEALRSATSVPAKAFRLADRGRVRPGLRADLLLVDGDPTADIRHTRAIVGVWKAGTPFDREAYRTALAGTGGQAAAVLPPPGLGDGLISDFEGDEPSARFGAGWVLSTDSIAGGSSTARMRIVPDGANGTRRSLEVAGSLSGGPISWAGVMFSPGATTMAPVDVSARRGISFWARGDGRTYQLLVFSRRRGPAPLVQEFTAGSEWKRHEIPFARFDGFNGSDLQAVVFSAGPPPGEFAFQIDEVRFD